METLIYFALWAAAIFLMMRLGCGAHVMGHNHEDAKTSVYAGNVYYFCSRECRETFEAAPNLYIEDLSQGRQELEPSIA